MVMTTDLVELHDLGHGADDTPRLSQKLNRARQPAHSCSRRTWPRTGGSRATPARSPTASRNCSWATRSTRGRSRCSS
eukprot:9774470-Heterocapsa_arctica.AAC.1